MAQKNRSTAGHKRRKRKICCFYKDEFISRRDLEHLSLRYAELNRFSHLRAHYVLFICGQYKTRTADHKLRTGYKIRTRYKMRTTD